LSDALREHTVSLVRQHYADFGPTLAAEKLEERHALRISRETLRTWMIQAELWLPRAERKRFHQPRHPREYLGELIQIDRCQHRWFEDRGPPCTFLVFVDDAASRLMALGFVPSESALAYFDVLRRYLETHGKPVAFYSDKHSIFRVSKEEASSGDGMTQFSRALAEAPASGASWDLPATRPGGSVSILKQYVCDEPAVHASFFGYQKSIRAAQLTPACPRYPSSPSTDDDGVERRSECARETSQSSRLGTYSACRDIVAEATAVRSPLALLQGW
jgi:hypothetical protein